MDSDSLAEENKILKERIQALEGNSSSLKAEAVSLEDQIKALKKELDELRKASEGSGHDAVSKSFNTATAQSVISTSSTEAITNFKSQLNSSQEKLNLPRSTGWSDILEEIETVSNPDSLVPSTEDSVGGDDVSQRIEDILQNEQNACTTTTTTTTTVVTDRSSTTKTCSPAFDINDVSDSDQLNVAAVKTMLEMKNDMVSALKPSSDAVVAPIKFYRDSVSEKNPGTVSVLANPNLDVASTPVKLDAAKALIKLSLNAFIAADKPNLDSVSLPVKRNINTVTAPVKTNSDTTINAPVETNSDTVSLPVETNSDTVSLPVETSFNTAGAPVEKSFDTARGSVQTNMDSFYRGLIKPNCDTFSAPVETNIRAVDTPVTLKMDSVSTPIKPNFDNVSAHGEANLYSVNAPIKQNLGTVTSPVNFNLNANTPWAITETNNFTKIKPSYSSFVSTDSDSVTTLNLDDGTITTATVDGTIATATSTASIPTSTSSDCSNKDYFDTTAITTITTYSDDDDDDVVTTPNICAKTVCPDIATTNLFTKSSISATTNQSVITPSMAISGVTTLPSYGLSWQASNFQSAIANNNVGLTSQKVKTAQSIRDATSTTAVDNADTSISSTQDSFFWNYSHMIAKSDGLKEQTIKMNETEKNENKPSNVKPLDDATHPNIVIILPSADTDNISTIKVNAAAGVEVFRKLFQKRMETSDSTASSVNNTDTNDQNERTSSISTTFAENIGNVTTNTTQSLNNPSLLQLQSSSLADARNIDSGSLQHDEEGLQNNAFADTPYSASVSGWNSFSSHAQSLENVPSATPNKHFVTTHKDIDVVQNIATTSMSPAITAVKSIPSDTNLPFNVTRSEISNYGEQFHPKGPVAKDCTMFKFRDSVLNTNKIPVNVSVSVRSPMLFKDNSQLSFSDNSDSDSGTEDYNDSSEEESTDDDRLSEGELTYKEYQNIESAGIDVTVHFGSTIVGAAASSVSTDKVKELDFQSGVQENLFKYFNPAVTSVNSAFSSTNYNASISDTKSYSVLGKCMAAEETSKVDQTFSKNEMENSTPQDSQKKFKCPTCGETFNRSLDILWHGRTHLSQRYSYDEVCYSSLTTIEGHEQIQSKTGLQECLICGKDYSVLERLKEHVKMHTEVKFICSPCQKTFYKGSDLLLHLKTHEKSPNEEENSKSCNAITEGGIKRHECPICRKTYSLCEELLEHMQTHTEENAFSCLVCQKIFPTPFDMKQHKCTPSKPHVCSMCGRRYSSPSLLRNHLRTHTGERPFKCPVCHKTFTSKPRIRKHMKVHSNEKQFKCSVCGKTFLLKYYLQIHMRSHTGEKPYKCSSCEMSFTTRSALTAHIRTHTGEKPYKCSECTRSFAQISGLKDHMRRHTGEKPYLCQTCGKSFSCVSSFNVHKKIHTGQRQYECSVCGKKFITSSSLYLHKRVHTEERPYKCMVCGKAFKYNAHLKRHSEIHMKVRGNGNDYSNSHSLRQNEYYYSGVQ